MYTDKSIMKIIIIIIIIVKCMHRYDFHLHFFILKRLLALVLAFCMSSLGHKHKPRHKKCKFSPCKCACAYMLVFCMSSLGHKHKPRHKNASFVLANVLVLICLYFACPYWDTSTNPDIKMQVLSLQMCLCLYACILHVLTGTQAQTQT